ncbi:energy-coupling factor transporter transmembrane protein EcfT [Mycoplasma sp. Pen4]|uniref:energy-coupling factor transporter transmembrane component T family protein n=1 Tax=Mycoplasma sp. Pen4 TaxID=640330 RepID=UPI00165441D2|nr:energy-coupling factor transporter transmembrane component T [Mycoplasma sp. Pen4]QNM93620.1 energy-coupling factor transporter transmembrane protein EcfT [Mycoplasma sp. Pen4]
MKSVFGRYIPGSSILYRIDPRIKLLSVIFYLVMVFLVRYYVDMLILLTPLVIMYIWTTKKIGPVFRLMKLPIFITVVIFLVNMYTITNITGINDYQSILKVDALSQNNAIKYLYGQENGGKMLWTIVASSTSTTVKINGIETKLNIAYGINWDGINRTLSLFLRIYIMIILTALLTNTSRPILLTKAIEDILYPLKFLFVPTHVIAMIISIALRFIPTLIDEANRIIKAQTSRGVDFRHGNLKEKIAAFTTLIIPLFVSSFAKAEDLSNSMETRGYDPYAKRVKYRVIKPGWRDLLYVIFLLGLMSFVIVNIYYPDYLPSWYIASYII